MDKFKRRLRKLLPRIRADRQQIERLNADRLYLHQDLQRLKAENGKLKKVAYMAAWACHVSDTALSLSMVEINDAAREEFFNTAAASRADIRNALRELGSENT